MSPLSALVLTRDLRPTARLLSPLASWGVAAELETEPRYVLGNLLRRHFDGCIIDFDSIASAGDTVAHIRAAAPCKLLPILALVNGAETAQPVLNAGVNCVLAKSASPARARSYLRIALLLMTREHLRYCRYPLDAPAAITYAGGPTLEARTLNISHEGLALRLTQPMRVTRTIRARFQIPSREPSVVVATGHTAWSDAQGRLGLRFLYMPEPSRARFQQYMTELHARTGPDLARAGLS